MPVQTSLFSAHATCSRLLALLATAALLSACSSQPRISAQQESTQYRARAGRTYTPPGSASDPWGPYISEAAAKFDVPERWVREVMRQESGGRLYGRGGDLITSGAGAMGLMQVMPATYDEIRGRYPELGSDPYDPHNNILAGTAYIREMYDIYGSPGFLAAYNAGPGRLDDYLTRNRTLPEETRRYVAAIGPKIAGAEPRTPSPGQQYAMNAMPFSIPDGPRYAASSRYSAPSTYTPPAYTPPATTSYASNGPYITLNPPQPVVQDVPAPIQLAPPPAGPAIVLRPQPVEVAEAPEPKRNPIVLRPQPVEVAQLAEPPRFEPQRPEARRPYFTPAPATAQFAQMPQPPAYVPPPSPFREPARTQQQLAVAALVPVSPRGGAFNFISSAHAEPVGAPRVGGGGGWAVQVGAFASEGLAASATTTARDHAREVLGGARSNVSSIRQPRGVLYRARLTGLSRDAASQACERLTRARTTCIVVSPDAQS